MISYPMRPNLIPDNKRKAVPYLSIVTPCYNEQEVLPEFYRRTSAVGDDFGKPLELVLVNDGSKDRTWEIMQELAANDPRVDAVKLSRNHGHQLALTAGLSVCRGEPIFILDADLQDQPELLGEMNDLIDRESAEVVYGVRRTRPFDTQFKRFACLVFYRLLDKLTDTPIPLDTGDFRLMSRHVLISTLEQHRFLGGMIAWIGFRQLPLAYDRDARHAGRVKYPLRKLITLATAGVVAFSVRPLSMAIYLGILTGVFALGLLVYALLSWLVLDGPKGWSSLMGGIGILGSVQMVILGVFGVDLGRLYEQSKGRPLFIIDEIVRAGAAQPDAGSDKSDAAPSPTAVISGTE